MGATAEAVRAAARAGDQSPPTSSGTGRARRDGRSRGHLDALRIAVGKVESLAAVAAESYDNTIWNNTDPLQLAAAFRLRIPCRSQEHCTGPSSRW